MLILFHFFIPFILLLGRRAKRSINVLAAIAIGIVFMRLVDLYWNIAPMYAQGVRHDPPQFEIHWLGIAAAFGIGGIWLATFIRELGRFPILPLNDPRLEEVRAHG